VELKEGGFAAADVEMIGAEGAAGKGEVMQDFGEEAPKGAYPYSFWRSGSPCGELWQWEPQRRQTARMPMQRPLSESHPRRNKAPQMLTLRI